MQRSRFKKSSYEDKFDRKYACWARNHQGWRKYKKSNRRSARRAVSRELRHEEEKL